MQIIVGVKGPLLVPFEILHLDLEVASFELSDLERPFHDCSHSEVPFGGRLNQFGTQPRYEHLTDNIMVGNSC